MVVKILLGESNLFTLCTPISEKLTRGYPYDLMEMIWLVVKLEANLIVRCPAANMGETQLDEDLHSGGFGKGLGLALASAFLGTFLLLCFTLAVTESHHSFFWTVVIIAGAFPTLTIYFAKRWAKESKSMASGGRVAVIIGLIIAVSVVVWFLDFLSRLGN